MSDKVPFLMKIYYASCSILLAVMAILIISIAYVNLDTRNEVRQIRLLLQNDYEIIYRVTE